MGTQQLLVLILGLIVVGVATVVAISIFGTSSQQANADAILNDCLRIAATAQTYYAKPPSLGGGGGSFDGFSLRSAGIIGTANANGTYSISRVRHDHFHIRGTGIEKVRVSLPVFPDSIGSPTIWINGIAVIGS